MGGSISIREHSHPAGEIKPERRRGRRDGGKDEGRKKGREEENEVEGGDPRGKALD